MDRAAILRLVSAALHPNEALSVRAIEVLGTVPTGILKVFQGYLRALFDALLDRRDTSGLLLTPAIEAFIDSLPFLPAVQTHLPGLLEAESSGWTEDVQRFIASEGALEDEAYARLLGALEWFPSLLFTPTRWSACAVVQRRHLRRPNVSPRATCPHCCR